jgi:very-short-patch-repair endonuclease
MRRYSDEQLAFARRLRRDMTGAEAILWRALRGCAFMGLKFRRQVPIGKYVVDFLCVEHRLIVELDGAPHDDPRQKQYDARRDAELTEQGYKVLRFRNDLIIGGGDIALDHIRAAISRDEGASRS